MYQRKWTPHVGEKATTVREPGSEHDQFAVAVLEDATLCTVGHFFLVMQDLSLFASLVVSTISEAGNILQDLFEVVCTTHFCLSLLSFLNFGLLLD